MSGGTYNNFGDWPQTIKAADVTVGSGTLVRGGLSYHVGSDGNYYVKAEEKAAGSGDAYKYSDGTQAGQNGNSSDTVESDYSGDAGFLQTAFTENAQKEIIVDTEVDNSALSTSDAEEKLSQATDYAKATRAFQNPTAGYGGAWWLRSPKYDREFRVCYIIEDGNADSGGSVSISDMGVVPALCVSASDIK